MILLNPINGAEIKSLFYKDVKIFEEPFKVDSLVKVDDEIGRFVMSLYDFVTEITKEEAVKFLEDKKNIKFKCECGIGFGAEKAYLEHKKQHEVEAKLDDELGIPVIKVNIKKVEDVDNQANIDNDLLKEGITGEGIRIEKNEVKARF